VQIDIALASVRSSAAFALVYAAQDELDRRYGHVDADPTLDFDEFTPPRGAFLIARADTDLAGGVGLKVLTNNECSVGEIKRLWTRPDLRRHGVGRALMERAHETAREFGVVRLYLETGYAQPEAIAFYRSLGWTEVEAFPTGIGYHAQATKFSLAV
jgi:GNAT superfamily N-acetyltransferase